MKLRRTLCACCLAVVAMPHTVAAQNYTFTNIADTTGPFSEFVYGGGPRLNNSGTVSFVASLDAGDSGVYRSDGVVTTTIADETGPLSNFRYHDINDAGQVAYRADAFVLGPGVFRGDGLSTTTIVWEREYLIDLQGTFNFFGPISINNPGTVAFLAIGSLGNSNFASIFVGNGGGITFISDGQDYQVNGGQINNLGTVAFQYDQFFSAGSGIALGTGGTTSTVIDHTGPYSSFGTPGFNDNNVVAVAAGNDAGGVSVLRIDGATVDVVAGPYTTLGGVGINNAGDVAFLAELTPNMYAILAGPDPVTDKVIGDGDALFGSTATVTGFDSSGASPIDGPNDAGQIVFRYSLADGRSGIALATPIAGLAGDYNHDDVVDAADYVVWRKGMISGNSTSPGTGNDPDPNDYNTWRTHFGETLVSSANASSLPANEGVPEPNSFALMCIAAASVAGTLRGCD